MKSFERITYRDPDTGKRRSAWAQIEEEGPVLLLLTPVDRFGEDRSHFNGDGVLVEVQQLLSKDLILTRQPARQNPTYGSLEVIRGE